jgi:hypothetical protein
MVGSQKVTLRAGQTQSVLVSLNRAGRRLLTAGHHLNATLRTSQALSARQLVTVSTQTLRFSQPPYERRHR